MNKFTNLAKISLFSLFMATSASVLAANNVVETSAVEVQNVPIKGIILDESGQTVIGATVVIQGTTTGVTTGIDGDFAFSAPVGSTIAVSYVGYKGQTFTVLQGQEVYNLTLVSEALAADEVVVTALGIKREQKALGYAVTDIKGEEIAGVNTTSAVTALQGRAPGVSIKQSGGGIMSSTQIQIRGTSTLGGGQPIFIVDGVILENDALTGNQWGDEANDYGNDLKNLNPDDFESMSVLKGSAATALYGSRGINGAVVITTKSGKAGKGVGVSFSQTTGIDVVYRTPDFQNEFTQGQMPGYIDYANQPDGSMNIWDNSNPYFEEVDGKFMPSLRDYSGANWGPSIKEMHARGYDKVVGFDGSIEDYKLYPNNMKDGYEVGVNTSTNLTISGGTEKATFYLSNTYQYRKGTFPGNTFERNSTLLKGSYKATDKLSFEASISFNSSNGTNSPFNIGRQYWYGEFNRNYDVDKYEDLWETTHGGAASSNFGDEYGSVPGMDYFYQLNTRQDKQTQNIVTPIIRASYKFTDWLTLNAEANMNLNYTKMEKRRPGSGYQQTGTDALYYLGFDEKIQRSAKTSLNFNKRFGDFGTSFIVGGEWYRKRDAFLNTQTTSGFIVPGQFFLGNSAGTKNAQGGLQNFKNIYSVYFLASFDYKSKLFLDVTGRNDWSTALVYSNGKGNNSYFYPSVSGSWLFSDSFDMPEWVSFGKLRASWAQVGNDTTPYTINGTYGVKSTEYANGQGYYNTYTNTLIDPNLKPERKNSFEAGLDVRFLSSRIGLDVTYYKENTKDQIVTLGMAAESGIAKQLTNAGNIQNQGWEIALNTTPIKKKDFSWDLDLIYTRNRNKIIELHEDMGDYKQLYGNQGEGGAIVAAYVGGVYGQVLSNCIAKKDDNGNKILVWNEDARGARYTRDKGTPQIVGDVNPDFEGSITNNFKYKGFNLSFLIDGRFGGYVQSFSSRYATSLGLTESSLKYRTAEYGGTTFTSKWADAGGLTFEDGVIPEGVFADKTIVKTPEGGKQDVSGMSYKDAYEKGYVEPTRAAAWHYFSNSWGAGVHNDDFIQDDLRYVSLRNISLGYTFPNKVVKKLRMQNLHLSLDAQNVCYLYNNMPNSVNPEAATGTQIYDTKEMSFMPYTATYSLAIRFNM